MHEGYDSRSVCVCLPVLASCVMLSFLISPKYIDVYNYNTDINYGSDPYQYLSVQFLAFACRASAFRVQCECMYMTTITYVHTV